MLTQTEFNCLDMCTTTGVGSATTEIIFNKINEKLAHYGQVQSFCPSWHATLTLKTFVFKCFSVVIAAWIFKFDIHIFAFNLPFV